MSNVSLADLYEDLREHQHKVEHIEDAIARHQEYIADVFASSDIGNGWPAHLERVIASVARLEQCSGEYDRGGRGKNIIPWNGYRYRVADDPKEYWVRSGSNWCSSVHDWAEYGSDVGPDIDIGRVQRFPGAKDETLAWICELPTPMAVAYLLMLVIGW